MSKEGKSSLVGRELLAAAVVTGAIIFLMLWLVGDRSFIGSLIVGAVLGYVVHYVFASLKSDSYTPPGAMASSAPAPVAPTPTPVPAKPVRLPIVSPISSTIAASPHGKSLR